MSNMLNQSRRSYQDHHGIDFAKAIVPFAGPTHQTLLSRLEREALKAGNATTQAAYLLRLQNIRAIVKQL